MTQTPDDNYPEEPHGSSGSEGGRKIDEDALWAEIVANYGDRPPMGEKGRSVEPVETTPGETEQPRRRTRPPRNLFDRAYIESTTERSREMDKPGSWDDEGHYTPPEPPPVPVPEPRRRMAWIGLFGAPALMLVGIVLGWSFPSWVSALLVSGFVGGFIYLIATMPRDGRGHWPGDDGAVV